MFNKQSKEEKKEEKIKRLMECYHLDIFEDDIDKDIAAEMAKQMAGNNNMLLFNSLTRDTKDMLLMIAYQNDTIITQNNMIIRLLEKISKK